jgi:hypothetical protein
LGSGRYANLIPRDPPYDARVDRIPIAVASVALLVPSVLFAFNACISYRERGLVEPYDIPAAIAFLIAAVFTWRLLVVALVLTLQTLPVPRRPVVSST